MRKKALLPFFLSTAAVSLLCASCKGGGLAVVSVEPHVVYDFSSGSEAEQYLFVFVRTEGCDGVRAMGLYDEAASLRWQSTAVSKAGDDLFYAAFSPAPSERVRASSYLVTISDFYGGSAELPFTLSYDAGMESFGSSSEEELAAAGLVRRYAYFDKGGCLEIFAEMDKDIDAQLARKNMSGRRLCCVSPDGATVCLFPYRAIQ